MENKKANHDQRKWFLLFLVALTPPGITAGNPLRRKTKFKSRKCKNERRKSKDNVHKFAHFTLKSSQI